MRLGIARILSNIKRTRQIELFDGSDVELFTFGSGTVFRTEQVEWNNLFHIPILNSVNFEGT